MALRKLFVVLSVLFLYTVSATIVEPGSRFFSEHSITHSASPYTIAFKNDVDNGCSGALISESFVLTAAQCVDDYSKPLEVILGAYDTSIKEKQQVRQLVEENDITIHPKFDPRTLENDIALIRLPSKVLFNQFIERVVLDDGKLSFNDKDAYLTGLGNHIMYPIENRMFHEELTVVSNKKCKMYKPLHVINEAKLCAFHKSVWNYMGIYFCISNPGSPLVIKEEQGEVLVGIASSRTRICNDIFSPAVFTRVSPYKKWIDERLAKAIQVENNSDETVDEDNSKTVGEEEASIEGEPFDEDDEDRNELIEETSDDEDEDANEIFNEEGSEEIKESDEE